MTKNLVTVNGVNALPIVTSHSIDGTFDYCRRKFEFAHVWQQVPESGLSGMAAEVGTALHEAVQEWARIYLMPGVNRDDPAIEAKAVRAASLTLLRWWPFVLNEIAVERKQLAAKQRSFAKSMHLLMRIITHPLWDDYELAFLPDETPAIEIPWRIVHASKGVLTDAQGRKRVLVTQGKIDFVLRDRQTGEVRVFDLKTTTKEEDSLFGAYRFSGQALGYSFIVHSALGVDVRETGMAVTYLVASFDSFKVIPTAFRLSPDEIQDYIRNRDMILDDMTRHLSEQWWPRRMHGCDSFNSMCPYLSVCHRRDPAFLSMWFEAEETPFIERPRVYETYWTFMG